MKNYFGIHPAAIIGDNVTLGEDVTVGARTIVYDNVEIGDGTFIGPDCIIGEPNVAIHSQRDTYVNLNRPGFRRHLAAINYGLGGGGYEHEALHG